MEAEASTQHKRKGVETNGGYHASGSMSVVPPRPEDLQQSYAAIVGDVHDKNEAGWYGAMSMSRPTFRLALKP